MNGYRLASFVSKSLRKLVICVAQHMFPYSLTYKIAHNMGDHE